MDNTQQTCLRTHGTLIGRSLLGLLFFVSGLNMLLGEAGIAGVTQMIDKIGIPLASIVAVLVVAVKVFAGAGLILGYRVRYASIALIVFTVLTILFVHNDLAQLTAALKNLSIIGGLLYVLAYGAGDGWKIDKE